MHALVEKTEREVHADQMHFRRHSADSGKIFLDNKEFLSIGPKDTIEHGIVTVYQELNLIPSLSVAENVFVGERRGRKIAV